MKSEPYAFYWQLSNQSNAYTSRETYQANKMINWCYLSSYSTYSFIKTYAYTRQQIFQSRLEKGTLEKNQTDHTKNES